MSKNPSIHPIGTRAIIQCKDNDNLFGKIFTVAGCELNKYLEPVYSGVVGDFATKNGESFHFFDQELQFLCNDGQSEYLVTIEDSSRVVYKQRFLDIDIPTIVRMINFNASRASEEPSLEDECEAKAKDLSDPIKYLGENT